MSFAYVKFIEDNTFSIVPLHCIRHFDVANWSINKTYQVFWSPNGTPPPGGCNKHGSNDNAGYFKAVVLMVEETEKALEEKIEKTRVRCGTSKILIDNDSHEQKPEKRQEAKDKKKKLKKGHENTIKSLFDLDNKKRSRNPERISRNLFDTSGLCSSDLCSDDDTDEEVIPRKMLREVQAKHEVLKKKYKTLKMELSTYKQLNVDLQKSILDKFQDSNVASFTTTKSHIEKANSTLTTTPTSIDINFNDVHLPDMTSRKENVMAASPRINGLPEASAVFDAKLLLAKHVKRGKGGDSQYAKNLATLFWTNEELEKRSVTGRKCNAIKNSASKEKLTPEKLSEVKRLFRERLQEEEPTISNTEIDMRCANVNAYIAQKIVCLNRKLPIVNDESVNEN